MFELLMGAAKGLLSEFAGGGGKGGGSAQMYDPVNTKRLAFAAEKQAALSASRDAMQLSGSRFRDKGEGTKQKSKYAEEVVQLLRGMENTRVREALIKQMASSGIIDHSSLQKFRTSSTTVDDTATTKKPVGFV